MYKKFKNKAALDNFISDFDKIYTINHNLNSTLDLLYCDDDTYTTELIQHLKSQNYNLDDLIETNEYYCIAEHKNPKYHNEFVCNLYKKPESKIAKINGNMYLLEDWDGEKYINCCLVDNVTEDGHCSFVCGFYTIKPSFDTSGNMIDFEIVESR